MKDDWEGIPSPKKLTEEEKEEEQKVHIEKAEKKSKEINEKYQEEIRTSFFTKDGNIFEQVIHEGQNKFAVWDESKEEITYIPYYKTNYGKTYFPNEGEEIKEEDKEGYIHLPSKAEEYESDEILEDDIKGFIRKWLDIDEEHLQYVVWSIKQSWIYDRLRTVNYLRALGDTTMGKTRYLDTIGRLHYKAIKTSGASTVAPVFRLIKKWKGSLLIDEFDLKSSDETADFIKLINLGFEKGQPILRCNSSNPEKIDFFDPYCPKVLATRKPFLDKATESRCFTKVMTGTDRKDIPAELDDSFFNEAMNLRNKLLMWRFKNYFKISIDKVKNIDLGDLEPRVRQTHMGYLPLFAHNEKKLEFFRTYLQQHQQNLIEDRRDSFEGKIVDAFCILVFSKGKEDIAPMDLIKEGGFTDPRDKTKQYSPISLGRYLKELGLGNRKTRNIDGQAKNCIVWQENQLRNLAKRYGVKIIDVYKSDTIKENPEEDPW